MTILILNHIITETYINISDKESLFDYNKKIVIKSIIQPLWGFIGFDHPYRNTQRIVSYLLNNFFLFIILLQTIGRIGKPWSKK